MRERSIDSESVCVCVRAANRRRTTAYLNSAGPTISERSNDIFTLAATSQKCP